MPILTDQQKKEYFLRQGIEFKNSEQKNGKDDGVKNLIKKVGLGE